MPPGDAYGQVSLIPVSFVVPTHAGGENYFLELEFRIWACIYRSTRTSTLSYTSKRDCASIEPSVQFKLGSAKRMRWDKNHFGGLGFIIITSRHSH